MGWNGGTGIARAVAEAVLKHVPEPKTREKIYKPFYEEMSDADWDTQDEAAGVDPIFDKVLGLDMDYHKFVPFARPLPDGASPTHDPRGCIVCRSCGLKEGHKLHGPRPKEDDE